VCGIAGIAGSDEVERVSEMLLDLAHRGPDSEGVVCTPGACLGHRRLSIIDLEGGYQPMCDSGGESCIAYNGEIYNYQDLRGSLADADFLTSSDTEVILKLSQSRRPTAEWLQQLDGMFAFAIAGSDGLLLARDPLGIKPLYLGRRGEKLAFASEIKALQDVAEKIAEFPPGYFYTSRDGLRSYFEFAPEPADILEAGQAEEQLLQTLERSVRTRLIADVPVGVFLSGGLDSSLIAALARRYKNPLDTFAVGMEGSEDIKAARKMARFLGTRHHEYLFSLAEALRFLPEVIYHLESFDRSLVRSAIPNFFLARLASEHVKVSLSGEGADELFAGYDYLKGLGAEELERELREITVNLHNTNLQRCDRMSMAHGLEVRVPLLDDLEVVKLAFRIPLWLKLAPESKVVKWVLRRVAERLLPHEVAWRPKQKFADGAGLGAKLAGYADIVFSDQEFQREREVCYEAGLQSKEELLYYRLFKESFPNRELVPLVGRSRSL
jgi:asparagine synthase (glutamine-hydrolysing)